MILVRSFPCAFSGFLTCTVADDEVVGDPVTDLGGDGSQNDSADECFEADFRKYGPNRHLRRGLECGSRDADAVDGRERLSPGVVAER